MNDIKKIVKHGYSKIARTNSCCCKCKNLATQIGYNQNDITEFSNVNMGLGCGNPTAIGDIKEGDVVLDLGCGAGFDVFLAQRKVGDTGKVIGVDMTEEMITKAKQNTEKLGLINVEFILGDIENLPIQDATINVIISNCVINLAPDKDKVFQEAFRVLKQDGALYLSDIVLLGELTIEQKQNPELLTGCVSGALQKEIYLEKIRKAGFDIEITKENKDISKQQYQGINLESISVRALKRCKI